MRARGASRDSMFKSRRDATGARQGIQAGAAEMALERLRMPTPPSERPSWSNLPSRVDGQCCIKQQLVLAAPELLISAWPHIGRSFSFDAVDEISSPRIVLPGPPRPGVEASGAGHRAFAVRGSRLIEAMPRRLKDQG